MIPSTRIAKEIQGKRRGRGSWRAGRKGKGDKRWRGGRERVEGRAVDPEECEAQNQEEDVVKHISRPFQSTVRHLPIGNIDCVPR